MADKRKVIGSVEVYKEVDDKKKKEKQMEQGGK